MEVAAKWILAKNDKFGIYYISFSLTYETNYEFEWEEELIESEN